MAAAVSISIKIVGVLVLSAMIALPVASALQLEKGFRTTLLCSIGFSLLAMIIGLFWILLSQRSSWWLCISNIGRNLASGVSH